MLPLGVVAFLVSTLILETCIIYPQIISEVTLGIE